MVSSHVNDFIEANFPDYEGESWKVVKIMIGLALFWGFVVPSLASRPVVEENASAQDAKSENILEKAKTSSKDSKGTKKGRKASHVAKNAGTQSTTSSTKQQAPQARYIPLWANVASITGLLCSVIYVLFTMSPYNYYTPRRVFEAPLLTHQECQQVVAMAERAAQRNVPQDTSNTSDPLLQEPVGWQKTRHGSYPTTDLNLVTDPFTKEDRAWISDLLDRRLAPSMERFLGVPPAAIRMNDLFIVRYDAGKRTHLANHTDDADISFNVLLTDDFEGGGTRFWHRATSRPFAHVEPTTAGMGLMHGAQIHHEGYHVSKGTRIILVGFTSVDRFDPWTGQSTGLSLMASWFNMAWFHIRCRAGYFLSVRRTAKGSATQLYDTQYVRLLFRDLITILKRVLDRSLEHAVTTAVSPSNATAYLKALDTEYEARGKYLLKANWFKGQNVDLEVVSPVGQEGTWPHFVVPLRSLHVCFCCPTRTEGSPVSGTPESNMRADLRSSRI